MRVHFRRGRPAGGMRGRSRGVCPHQRQQTIALIDRLAARGIYTLFLSTNQVFSGERPHVPADAPVSPVSEYGRQKAEAERVLRSRMANGAPIGVLRLAKVVSPGMALVTNWRQELTARTFNPGLQRHDDGAHPGRDGRYRHLPHDGGSAAGRCPTYGATRRRL